MWARCLSGTPETLPRGPLADGAGLFDTEDPIAPVATCGRPSPFSGDGPTFAAKPDSSAKPKVSRVTVVVMTETTPEQPNETTATGEPPARWDGRWDKSHRRGGRPFRLAALVVTLAGVVFIIAVIFWSGFILGACEGGEGGHERHNGMTPYGVVIEQTVPAAALAA
jgi:hypothetical protein